MRYITPEHCLRKRLGDRPAPDWAAALLVFRDHPSSLKVVEAFDGARPVTAKLLYNISDPPHGPFVHQAEIGGRKVVIVPWCVWGGPQTAILVEELACLGVKLILGYGIAGSIDPALPQGEFVVAESALPVDGTSRAYGGAARQPADAGLLGAAVAAGAEAGCEMKPVVAVTVDALYRETEQFVEALRRQGGQIVNMETSTLYTVAAACGVRAVWLGYVSDCLAAGQWHDWYADLGDLHEKGVGICRRALEAVLAG